MSRDEAKARGWKPLSETNWRPVKGNWDLGITPEGVIVTLTGFCAMIQAVDTLNQRLEKTARDLGLK